VCLHRRPSSRYRCGSGARAARAHGHLGLVTMSSNTPMRAKPMHQSAAVMSLLAGIGLGACDLPVSDKCRQDQDCLKEYCCNLEPDGASGRCMRLASDGRFLCGEGEPGEQCVAGQTCLDGYCVAACEIDGDCLLGYACVHVTDGSRGGCLKRAQTTCTVPEGCPSDFECVSSLCVSTTATCRQTDGVLERCDRTTLCFMGNCVLAKRCSSGTCDGGVVLSSGAVCNTSALWPAKEADICLDGFCLGDQNCSATTHCQRSADQTLGHCL
jgi:hypothetical protein